MNDTLNMEGLVMDTLEQRVAELERRATRYRNALVLMVVGVCAVAVVGATTDDGVIRGQYLFLGNEQGETVVWAGASASGNGLLKVTSKTGTDLIYAGASANGTGFLFNGYNKAGEAVVQLSVDDYGNGVVGAYNRRGEGRTLKPGP